MLIRDAEALGQGIADVRIRGGRISGLGRLTAEPGEVVVDAGGGALLPGLHDHHLHFMSYAASLASVRCGPPQVTDAAALADTLRRAVSRSGGPEATVWLRGVGYHESVAGDLDRHWLDRHGPPVPVRIQHRSGRLWIVNSSGLELLRQAGADIPSDSDGRLFDQDAALRSAFRAALPPVAQASRHLAARGVTGFTDMTPSNDPAALTLLARCQDDGRLLQQVRMAGRPALTGAAVSARVTVGEVKFHLHEHDLPEFASLRDAMKQSHDSGRAVAVHCVTETELVFALAALHEAGSAPGDRIEHASVTPPALLDTLQTLGVTVVTQPNFVAERGDAYRQELPEREHPWLYRCRSFLSAAIPLAGGTDAPFGEADPWLAMAAAVERRTPSGAVLGAGEALTPEQALNLFLGSAAAPAEPRRLTVGAPADLCLLSEPWVRVRQRLAGASVRLTLIGGEIVWQRPAG